MSAGGGCDAAVTARTRCGWVKFRECDKLLYAMRFQQKMRMAVYKTFVRPAILCGSQAQCLKESAVRVLWRTGRSMARAIRVVEL